MIRIPSRSFLPTLIEIGPGEMVTIALESASASSSGICRMNDMISFAVIAGVSPGCVFRSLPHWRRAWKG